MTTNVEQILNSPTPFPLLKPKEVECVKYQ